MTKSEAFKDFNEEYSLLTDSDREFFSRIVLKLLDDTFLIKDKDEDRRDYLKANELLKVLRAYFTFIDFSLILDVEKGIMLIKTDKDTNRVHFRKLDTIILLILRYIYDEESTRASLHSDITTTVARLSQEVRKTDIYQNFDGKTGEFKDALRTLRRYKIIDFDGDLTMGSTIIKIYRTILIVVDTRSLEELLARINQYRGGTLNEKNQETSLD